jgi:hypothetical protein
VIRRACIARIALRLALLSLGLGSAECGAGPDPSHGGAVVGVQVDPSNSNGGSGYTQGIALGASALYTAMSGNLARVSFDGSGSSMGLFNANASVLELAVAAKDGSVWWAGGNGTNAGCAMGTAVMALWTSSDAEFLTIRSAAAPTATLCPSINGTTPSGPQATYGLVADDAWVVVALASASVMTSGPSYVPDQQGWPGSQFTPSPSGNAKLLRFDRQNPSAPMQTLPGVSSLATALTAHVLAQSTAEVYWLDASSAGTDRVMRATKSDWSTGQVVAAAPSNTLTGIAASDAYVAWATSAQPTPGATGCAVFASHADGPPAKIYDGSKAPFLCWGLAVDDTYAYFATTTVVEQFPGDTGGPTYMMGTGLGRVPLAGGSLQTVPLASSRWYGARRVLVDAQSVYAVDPNFVVRVDKSAFGE